MQYAILGFIIILGTIFYLHLYTGVIGVALLTCSVVMLVTYSSPIKKYLDDLSKKNEKKEWLR